MNELRNPFIIDDDEAGEPILRPELSSEDWSLTARTENMTLGMSVPFAPGTVWTVTPSGAIVAGFSDEYSFEIRYPDGLFSPCAAVPSEASPA